MSIFYFVMKTAARRGQERKVLSARKSSKHSAKNNRPELIHPSKQKQKLAKGIPTFPEAASNTPFPLHSSRVISLELLTVLS